MIDHGQKTINLGRRGLGQGVGTCIKRMGDKQYEHGRGSRWPMAFEKRKGKMENCPERVCLLVEGVRKEGKRASRKKMRR